MAAQRFFLLVGLMWGFALGGAGPASAHPHVWVSMTTQIIYGKNGELVALKEAWTFDEAFSAFALQGMAKTKNGTYGDDVLKPLAQTNIDSLKEYDYFVYGKSASHKVLFKDPENYYLTYGDDALTLHFTLPLKKPMPPHGSLVFEVYDPSFFVSFSSADKKPVTMEGAPQGCVFALVRPEEKAQTVPLGEAFFNNPNAAANYGQKFADKIVVNCP